MSLPRLALVALLSAAAPVAAETALPSPVAGQSVAELGRILRLDALFEVLREEGLAHGRSIEADMFPGRGGARWEATVAQIYDVGRMRAGFDAALAQALGPDTETLAEVAAFFGSELGQRILTLEIEARRAFLDTAREEAARVAADDAAAARDPKVALIRKMIEAADLLESNVAGSMSGNLAFMTGMAGTGVYGRAMSEDEILADIWSREDQIRSDSSTWLYAYLGLAYAPLSEAELQSYVAFWESPAGQRLNGALFAAFDQVFRPVSHELGRAAGQAMLSRDI
ncbi:DUF2059 domain-containing protein [Rhodobacter calidifons]|uniref:DUF2059 domain-containing protein n=1 Tax=Rhodobacter calidifons TaxID=2715277 RepID=A0ABX0GBG8_9RHOB|nr:DUF2059 domain-containing protein [Rhodobacter calidifons]NHB78486.1 DUF2059 domain-containing protein [Rhodobacter calidifons]